MDSRFTNQHSGTTELDTVIEAIAGSTDTPEALARSKANVLKGVNQSPNLVPAKSGRRQNVVRSVVLAASVLCLLLFATSFLGKDNLYAQMQQTLARCQTIQVTRYDVANDGAATKHNWITIKHDRLFRSESSDGEVMVMNFEDKFMMTLDAETKTGEVTPLYGTRFAAKHFQIILRLLKGQLPKDAKRIGTTTINGVKVVEYEVDAEDELDAMRILIDPATSLPVRIESLPGDFRLGDFQFNEPIEDEYFAATVPAGYSMTKFKWQPPVDDTALVLDPEVGLGTARFGMSSAEVIEELGQPDGTRLLPGKAPRQTQLVYASRGFDLYIDGQGRFRAISCSAGNVDTNLSRPFGGSLRGKFRFGDGRDKLHTVLGEPDHTGYAVSADPIEREAEKVNRPDRGGDKFEGPGYTINANFASGKITDLVLSKQFGNE